MIDPHELELEEIEYTEGPPPGIPLWNVYCPACKRHAIAAMQDWEGKPVAPDKFFCPDCLVTVEVLGRADQ